MPGYEPGPACVREMEEPRKKPLETLLSREDAAKQEDWLKPAGAPVKECPNFSFWVSFLELGAEAVEAREARREGVDWEVRMVRMVVEGMVVEGTRNAGQRKAGQRKAGQSKVQQ